MQPISLEGMTFHELKTLRTQIAEQMTKLHEQGLRQLKQRFTEDAATYGLTMEEVMGATKKKRRKRRKLPDNDDLPSLVEEPNPA